MSNFLAGVELPSITEVLGGGGGSVPFRTPDHTFYVDGGYSGPTTNGKQETPFTTIQGAIDAAASNSFPTLITTRIVVEGRGSTQTYNESLVIANKTIVLEGRNNPVLIGHIQQRIDGVGFALPVLSIRGFASITGDLFITEALGVSGAVITDLGGRSSSSLSTQMAWTGDVFNPTIQKLPWIIRTDSITFTGFVNLGADSGRIESMQRTSVLGSLETAGFNEITNCYFGNYFLYSEIETESDLQVGIYRTRFAGPGVECRSQFSGNAFIPSDPYTITAASEAGVVFHNCTLTPPASDHEWFGSGSGGDLDVFGSTTLTDFVEFRNGTVSPGSTLKLELPARFRGTLRIDNSGVIDASGSDGLSGSDAVNPGGGGAGAADSALIYPSSAGGDGQSPEDGVSTLDRAALGGGGGAGGDGENGGGGAGGTDTLSVRDLANPGWLLAGHQPGSLQSNQIFAGIGGGGGGEGTGEYINGATGGGGGGGGGGGAVVIAARKIFVAPGGRIDASGGDGGISTDIFNSEDGERPGSGGGGGGGVIILIYDALVGDPDVFCDVSGGAGGAQPVDLAPSPIPPGPKSFGNAGSDGRVILIPTHSPLITRFSSSFSYYGYGGVGGGIP